MLGVTYLAITNGRRELLPGGRLDYLRAHERAEIAGELAGAPLWAMSSHAPDALLAGPEVALHLRYLTCPRDGDWIGALRRASSDSRWIAVTHGEGPLVGTGPGWPRPGTHRCASVPLDELRDRLRAAGWEPRIRRQFLDVWRHP
jgi:hypothetical protein